MYLSAPPRLDSATCNPKKREGRGEGGHASAGYAYAPGVLSLAHGVVWAPPPPLPLPFPQHPSLRPIWTSDAMQDTAVGCSTQYSARSVGRPRVSENVRPCPCSPKRLCVCVYAVCEGYTVIESDVFLNTHPSLSFEYTSTDPSRTRWPIGMTEPRRGRRHIKKTCSYSPCKFWKPKVFTEMRRDRLPGLLEIEMKRGPRIAVHFPDLPTRNMAWKVRDPYHRGALP